ncbi:MAG: hypothetical protein WB799_20545 [Candidatus Sulfotelmatobacter sp.]
MRPLSGLLFAGKLEHEIRREPLLISFQLFVEPLHRHTVKFRKVDVEDDPLMAEN